MDYNILSLVPVILCFLLIFITKNAFISILFGIASSVLLVLFKEYKFILLDSIIDVFSSVSVIQTVLFILIVGAIIKSTELSGGVSGFINYLENKKIKIKSPVLVQLLTMFMGIILFVDATSSMAITAIVGKPLFKEAKISTEKLALITNSTASPIAWLIPFGGAAAFMTGILSHIKGIERNPFSYVFSAVFFQFYTISLLLILIISIIFKFEIGLIKKYKFEEILNNKIVEKKESDKAINMIFPILFLLIGILVIMLITGKGNVLLGNGSTAVFFSGIITLFITLIFYVQQKICTIFQGLKWYFEGVKVMFVVTLLLVIALIFSNLLTKIGTVNYIVGIFKVISPNFLPVMALLLSSIIAFSTGTSGGTVAIITGLLIPMAIISDVDIPLVLGAIVSGAVFGDQNSIISDSVILTSSVTGVDAVTHVKTQLPYTLTALIISVFLFLIFGFLGGK